MTHSFPTRRSSDLDRRPAPFVADRSTALRGLFRFRKHRDPEAWHYLGAGRHLAPGCLVGPFVQHADALSAIWSLLLGARARRSLCHRLPSQRDRSYCIRSLQSSWPRAFCTSKLETPVHSRTAPPTHPSVVRQRV